MAIPQLVYVDETGYHYADYPTVLAYYQESYRAIYGADVYLEPDSQDGQWVAIQAQAAYDTMALGAAIYNSFSPSTALGDALSRNVKINGIARNAPTFSNVDVVIVGQVGTEITDGAGEGIDGVKWLLPGSVIIPISGEITVNATCATLGAIQAGAGTIVKISTPTRGWQTINNPLAAVAGNPVETNAELRARQRVSTALPSLSVLDGLTGAIADLDDVTRYRSYENDTDAPDADGLPEHSIAIVVEGGDVQEIGDTIARKKTPGTATYGTTSVDTYDKYDLLNVINFFRPTNATITTKITLKALQGYTTGYEDLIAQAVTDFYNGLLIGDDVIHSRVYTPANLPGTQAGTTYDITKIELGKNAGVQAEANVIIAFNEVALGDMPDVTFVYI
jgi:uncharacterized phage protein gp47/JayE